MSGSYEGGSKMETRTSNSPMIRESFDGNGDLVYELVHRGQLILATHSRDLIRGLEETFEGQIRWAVEAAS